MIDIFNPESVAENKAPEDITVGMMKRYVLAGQDWKNILSVCPTAKLEIRVDGKPAPEEMTLKDWRALADVDRAEFVVIEESTGGVLIDA